MAVLPVKGQQPRCKFCKHESLEEINAILERRSRKEINLEGALEEIAALGVENPNADNVKAHWGTKGHYYWASDEVTDKVEQAVGDLTEKLNKGEVVFADADAALDWIITQGLEEQRVKLNETGRVGITVDHVLKAIDSKTKRRHNEAQQSLLGELGAALGSWAGKQIESGERPALNAGEVEHEVVVEEAEVVESS